jgi:hypothetical protein
LVTAYENTKVVGMRDLAVNSNFFLLKYYRIFCEREWLATTTKIHGVFTNLVNQIGYNKLIELITAFGQNELIKLNSLVNLKELIKLNNLIRCCSYTGLDGQISLNGLLGLSGINKLIELISLIGQALLASLAIASLASLASMSDLLPSWIP